MDRVEPQLAVADRRIAVLELGAGGPQRLHLGALEHDPALEPLDQLVAMRGVPVGRHIARADLPLLALCHAARLAVVPENDITLDSPRDS